MPALSGDPARRCRELFRPRHTLGFGPAIQHDGFGCGRDEGTCRRASGLTYLWCRWLLRLPGKGDGRVPDVVDSILGEFPSMTVAVSTYLTLAPKLQMGLDSGLGPDTKSDPNLGRWA